ncbi:MAG TPA: hypothetical protein PKA50_11725, partial [Gemmatimonadales bacterium]|nr:hypothetical protein [Gemmatimonadales bacterium]
MASNYSLDFEKPLQELERQIEDLQKLGEERQIDVSEEARLLQVRLNTLRSEIYHNLSPIQRVQVARHPRRPYTLDYLSTIFTDFIELHGDRLFRERLGIASQRFPDSRLTRSGAVAARLVENDWTTAPNGEDYA